MTCEVNDVTTRACHLILTWNELLYNPVDAGHSSGTIAHLQDQRRYIFETLEILLPDVTPKMVGVRLVALLLVVMEMLIDDIANSSQVDCVRAQLL